MQASEKLDSYWQKLGSPNMNRFSARLILQKKVYLLQEMGLDMGYTFTKYIYGPYSAQLASDGFKMNIKDNSKDEFDDSHEALVKLDELEKGHEGNSAWFELLATITYLRNRMKMTKLEIESTIAKEKPYLYEKNLFEEACTKLVKLQVMSF